MVLPFDERLGADDGNAHLDNIVEQDHRAINRITGRCPDSRPFAAPAS
jgi:hypothetical protein